MDNNIDIPPFYLGQEVVANCNHRVFKKGQEFTITSVSRGCCEWHVTIGIKSHINTWLCTVCNKGGQINYGREWLFRASRFSPKIEISEFISMKELADKSLELIGAN